MRDVIEVVFLITYGIVALISYIKPRSGGVGRWVTDMVDDTRSSIIRHYMVRRGSELLLKGSDTDNYIKQHRQTQNQDISRRLTVYEPGRC